MIVPSPVSNPFSGAPFTLPPGATFNGLSLPSNTGYYFCSYGAASELLAELIDDIVAAGGNFGTSSQPLPEGCPPLAIVDGVSSGDYPQFALPGGAPATPYLPTAVWLWLFKGYYMNSSGQLCFVNDLAGLLIKRSIYPNSPYFCGDKNLVQIGSGATARMVGSPTFVELVQIAASGGLGQPNLMSAIWGPVSAGA